MANTATAQTALSIGVAGANQVIPYVISLDTTGADLTIRTPATGNMVGIVGLAYREASAHNLTIKTGSTTLLVAEFAATDAGTFIPIGSGGLLAVTAKSEALVIQTSVIITSMLMYVVESAKFNFNT